MMMRVGEVIVRHVLRMMRLVEIGPSVKNVLQDPSR